MRTLTALVIAVVLGGSLPAAAQTSEVKKYLNAAVTLYENLEYEKALKQIQKAKSKSSGSEDDARIALYEGIVLSDMGKEDRALTAFKTGLAMDPEGKLPLEVSPKVEAVFNKARDNVRKMLAPQLEKEREEARLKAEADRLAQEKAQADEQRKKDEEAARLAAQNKPIPPPIEVNQPPPAVVAQSSGPSMRKLGFIPLGLGVASAGVATYFLLGAKGKLDALNAGTVPPGEAIATRDSGKSMATLGYVFGAVGVAGLAAAGLMFALGGGGEGPAPVTVLATPEHLYLGVGGSF